MFKEKSSNSKFVDICKAIYPTIVWVAVTNIVAIFIVFILMFSAKNFGYGDVEKYIKNNELLIQLFADIVVLPILILIMHFRLKNAKKDNAYEKYELVNPFKFLLIVGFATCAMFAGNELVSLMEGLAPESMRHSYDDVALAIYSSPIWIQIICAGIIGPLVEELVFRFFLYGSLRRSIGKIWGAIITSALFGIIHGNWSQGVYAFLLSLAFIFVFEKYKSFVAPVIAHISSNIVGLIVSNAAKNVANVDSITNKPEMTKVMLLSLGMVFLVMLLLTVAFAVLIQVFVKPQKAE